MPSYLSDTPIKTLADDLYGVKTKTFAQSVAKAILGIEKTVGTVIALTGPWGTGTNGIVNLIRGEIEKAVMPSANSVALFAPINRDIFSRYLSKAYAAGRLISDPNITVTESISSSDWHRPTLRRHRRIRGRRIVTGRQFREAQGRGSMEK